MAVIEAGLGGRYDATNVIPSSVTGADRRRPGAHPLAGTDDRRHRDREGRRAAVPGSTLVLGADLDPDAVLAVAQRVSPSRARARRDRRRPGSTRASRWGARAPISGATSRWRARTAAEAYLGALDARGGRAAAAVVRVPGRLQQIDSEPLTLVDGAHNPDGTRALAESLPELVERRSPRGRRSSRSSTTRMPPGCCRRCSAGAVTIDGSS